HAYTTHPHQHSFPTRRSSDLMDWKKRKDTVYTPQAEFGDLSGLNDLPPAKVVVSKEIQPEGANNRMTVTVENQGKGVAFMVHPRDRKSTRLNSSHDQISYAVF